MYSLRSASSPCGCSRLSPSSGVGTLVVQHLESLVGRASLGALTALQASELQTGLGDAKHRLKPRALLASGVALVMIAYSTVCNSRLRREKCATLLAFRGPGTIKPS